MLSINTDFVQSHGDPEPYLRHIAEAGFTHVHWVHHWGGDFMYSPSEIAHIDQSLKTYGLIFSDLHASEGSEKFWLSKKEYARLAGVELVKNRLDMTAQLGGDAIVLHVQPDGMNDDPQPAFWDRFHRSMDALLPYATERNVHIAFENLFPRNHETLKQILAQYSPEQVGICYDSGHGNLIGDGLDFLEIVKDRLVVLHLNDNDATGDQHNCLFTGTVDWAREARLIAASSYNKPLSMELSVRDSGIKKPADFLAQAMVTGTQFAEMVAKS
mgnify:CR=1 FL=1